MKNSRKSIKVVTITAAVSIFGIGAAFALQAAGTSNSSDVKVVNSQAAAKTVVVEKDTHTEAASKVEEAVKASTVCNYYGQYGSFGENLGRYQNTPSESITGWHNSPAHYTCMVKGMYTRVGVGVAQDSNGNYYWAAIFMN